MSTKQMHHFSHGSGAYSDFPDHNIWFIPALIKHINVVLKATGPQIILKEYLEDDLIFDISDREITHTITVKYADSTHKLDSFIIELIKNINTQLIHRFNGYGIVPMRQAPPTPESTINSILYLAFASRLEVQHGIDGFTVLGSNDDYTSIIPEHAQSIPQILLPIPFEQLTLKYVSDYYDGDHHLPVYADTPEAIREELEKLLKLNPNNKIAISIGKIPDSSSEKVEVMYSMGLIQAKGLVDRWAFVELGNQFNQLLKEEERRYCLVARNDSNYLYVYCDKAEFELLNENDLVHEDYINTFIS